MSLEIPLRKEISEYEIKVVGQATARNLLWGGVAVGVCLGTAALAYFLRVPMELASWLFVFAGIPAIAIGFWRPQSGQAPERFFKDRLEHYFTKNSWAYHSESPYLVEEKEESLVSKKQARHLRRQRECDVYQG